MLAFTMCQPLILARFLNFLDDGSQDIRIGYALIGAYGLVYLGIALSSSFFHHRAYRVVVMLRGILTSAIFARTTKLGASSTNSDSVTLMSSNVSLSALWSLLGSASDVFAAGRSDHKSFSEHS
jgi:ATP-binding cassette, subfamily C (CFTR/MRP), member 1